MTQASTELLPNLRWPWACESWGCRYDHHAQLLSWLSLREQPFSFDMHNLFRSQTWRGQASRRTHSWPWQFPFFCCCCCVNLGVGCYSLWESESNSVDLLSPFIFMWVWGITFRPPGLFNRHLHQLSHLASPGFCFAKTLVLGDAWQMKCLTLPSTHKAVHNCVSLLL